MSEKAKLGLVEHFAQVPAEDDAHEAAWAAEHAGDVGARGDRRGGSLDVGFRADASQVCKDNAPGQSGGHPAHRDDADQAGETLKPGVQGKRRTAGRDLDYWQKVLGMVRI